MGEAIEGNPDAPPTATARRFDCVMSGDFAATLEAAGCSLVISAYQSGAVIIVGAPGGQPMQAVAPFKRPMGIALNGRDWMAVAAGGQIVFLADMKEAALSYPLRPNVYETLFVPRSFIHTGPLDLHDLAYAGDTLLGVNTRFSCLCRFDAAFNFTSIWQPPFISALTPDDRCHLNGMTLRSPSTASSALDGFATALGRSDSPRGWKAGRLGGGILMTVPNGDVIAEGLCMPHSPRLFGDELFILESGRGAVIKVDPATGRTRELARLPGYLRGLDRLGRYLVVGSSERRDGREDEELPVTSAFDEPLFCGVALVDTETGEIRGRLTYRSGCREIYDVKVLQGAAAAGILGAEGIAYRRLITTPTGLFWQTEPERREARR